MVTLNIVIILGDNPSIRSQSQEAQIFGGKWRSPATYFALNPKDTYVMGIFSDNVSNLHDLCT